MEDNRTDKTPDLIDTSDCLEAIGAIRSMKNFLFVVIMICLIITGAVFWLDRGGRIDKACSSVCLSAGCPSARAGKTCMLLKRDSICLKTENTDAPVKPIEDAAKAVTKAIGFAPVNDAAEPNESAVLPPQLSDANTQVKLSAADTDIPAQQDNSIPAIFMFRPSCWAISLIVKACNFILVIAATMYCLMLLMSLKISLTGRLGGINHISRAFFISLFALVILLPWQSLLPGVVVGAIYQPCELLCDWSAKADASKFWQVMCFLRFFCLWLVAFWLFIWAQVRSGKWAKATLRRLGLVR